MLEPCPTSTCNHFRAQLGGISGEAGRRNPPADEPPGAMVFVPMIHATPSHVRLWKNYRSAVLAGLVLVRVGSMAAQLVPLHNYVGQDMFGQDFSHNDAHGSLFYHAVLSNVDFTGTDLTGADIHEANVLGTNFTNALLDGADLRNHGDITPQIHVNHAISAAQLASAASITGINLHGNDLGGYNLGGLNLAGADLGSTDLSGADLSFTNLSGASLASIQSIESQLCQSRPGESAAGGASRG
jgi:uncharacterized protein YjbI with pentapeptide repeats